MNDSELLKKIANQLEEWADGSVNGGWDTHLVTPMRKAASNIYEHLGKTSEE